MLVYLRYQMARNREIENTLNAALQAGNKVWVIGDVHGHFEELQRLLENLELGENDKVLFVGDLIDRGPGSAQVIQLIRKDERLFSVKGNHERMMISAISSLRDKSSVAQWLYNGGEQTMDSFEQTYDKQSMNQLKEVVEWMKALPTEIVLDQHRIVHAGYDPRRPIDEQDEGSLLWIRDVFLLHQGIIDSDRQIVFGHTPTQKIRDGVAGQVKTSEQTLEDGRPSWIGIDTGICAKPEKGEVAVLTAYELSSEEIISFSKS